MLRSDSFPSSTLRTAGQDSDMLAGMNGGKDWSVRLSFCHQLSDVIPQLLHPHPSHTDHTPFTGPFTHRSYTPYTHHAIITHEPHNNHKESHGSHTHHTRVKFTPESHMLHTPITHQSHTHHTHTCFTHLLHTNHTPITRTSHTHHCR